MLESYLKELGKKNMFEGLGPLIPIVLESPENIIAQIVHPTEIVNAEVWSCLDICQEFIGVDWGQGWKV